MHMCTLKKAFTIATIMLILVCLATHLCLSQVKDHIATHYFWVMHHQVWTAKKSELLISSRNRKYGQECYQIVIL